MYFWSHTYPEASELHSHMNEGEAKMVVAFAVKCIKEGYVVVESSWAARRMPPSRHCLTEEMLVCPPPALQSTFPKADDPVCIPGSSDSCTKEASGVYRAAVFWPLLRLFKFVLLSSNCCVCLCQARGIALVSKVSKEGIAVLTIDQYQVRLAYHCCRQCCFRGN
jgi:hypothetical protein